MSNSQLDDADIHHERKKIFYRCNMLTRQFSKCSVAVKLQLFKTFCLCFYNIELWCKRLEHLSNSSQVKCVKYFLNVVSFIVLP